MAITTIYPTTHFAKAYRNLPEKIRLDAKHKEEIFKVNPFDNRLKTHKLKGRFMGMWSYSINYQHRIVFRFIDTETVIYYDIGTHDVYR